MGKYSGFIGFGINEQKENGIDSWDDKIVEHKYYGDIISNNRRYDQGQTISGDVSFTNQFKIIGNTFLFDHLTDIRYLTWKGNRWIVSSAEEQYPSVLISIGGLYNGPTPKDKRCST